MSKMEDLSHGFSKLYLCELSDKTDSSTLHAFLNDLLSIDYKINPITDYKFLFALLNKIPAVVKTDEAFLVSKSCKLFYIILKKHTIPQKETINLCKWLLKCLLTANDSVLVDVLNCFHIVLKTNHQHVVQLHESIIGSKSCLQQILNDDDYNSKDSSKCSVENSYQIQLAALKCIQALTQPYDNSKLKKYYLNDIHIESCSRTALKYLCKPISKSQDAFNHSEILICCCNILIQTYSNKSEFESHIGEIIGACRCWMFYGLDGFNNLLPQKVTPSQQAVAEISSSQRTRKGGKRLKLRKDKLSNPVKNWSENDEASNSHENEQTEPKIFLPKAMTSESDASDSECSRQSRLKSFQSQARLMAVNLLTIVIRLSEKHVIFGYWWCILPNDIDQSEGNFTSNGLAKCILNEPNASCRAAALTAMLSLLNISRNYLSQAETSKRTITSFTPFSVILGHTLENIHQVLSQILSTERSIPVLVAALKCTVSCIQATPYSKIHGDLLSGIIKNIRILLQHRDWTVQLNSIIVLGCILSINPPVVDTLKEVTSKQDIPSSYGKPQSNPKPTIVSDSEKDIFDCNSDEEYENITSEQETNPAENVVLQDPGKPFRISEAEIENMNWLIKMCLKNLGWTFKDECLHRIISGPPPIRLESLQLLSRIALLHFELLLAPYIKILTRVLNFAMKDSSLDITLHATRCAVSVGHGIQRIDESNEMIKMDDKLSFWIELLSGSLTEVLQSEFNPPARMAGCDCLSSMGENIYINLPTHLKLLCITLLLGLAGDEDKLVCAEAVRALGVFIMYPEWREDPCLIGDCGELILRGLQDSTPLIKIKVTWALANLTDAILLNYEEQNFEAIDVKLFLKFLEESIAATKENDKIQMNVMRSIGSILFMLSDDQMKKHAQLIQISGQAVERLVHCASSCNNMKVRWNACYSLGKTLRNQVLFEYHKNHSILIFKCLCNLIENCKNWKVKMHATMALCTPKNRNEYGDFFPDGWKCLLTSMENAQHIDDVYNYRYKDKLMEQLGIALAHFACLLRIEDLSEIYESSSFHWESASRCLQQVAHQTGSQSVITNKLIDAAKYVTTQLDCNTETQKLCLNILQNLFTWDLLTV